MRMQSNGAYVRIVESLSYAAHPSTVLDILLVALLFCLVSLPSSTCKLALTLYE